MGAFRANRTEKVGAFRANKTQKECVCVCVCGGGGGFTAAHTCTASIWEYTLRGSFISSLALLIVIRHVPDKEANYETNIEQLWLSIYPKCNKLKTKNPYLYKNMGRNGHGPKWYRPKWLWAKMVMGRNGYEPK